MLHLKRHCKSQCLFLFSFCKEVGVELDEQIGETDDIIPNIPIKEEVDAGQRFEAIEVVGVHLERLAPEQEEAQGRHDAEYEQGADLKNNVMQILMAVVHLLIPQNIHEFAITVFFVEILIDAPLAKILLIQIY